LSVFHSSLGIQDRQLHIPTTHKKNLFINYPG
jgi:hypothetical protein